MKKSAANSFALQARTLKGKDALASSTYRGRWVPVGNVKIA
jgi:hypothetical protein